MIFYHCFFRQKQSDLSEKIAKIQNPQFRNRFVVFGEEEIFYLINFYMLISDQFCNFEVGSPNMSWVSVLHVLG